MLFYIEYNVIYCLCQYLPFIYQVDHISYAWRCHALKKPSQDTPLTWPRKGTKPREHHKNFR